MEKPRLKLVEVLPWFVIANLFLFGASSLNQDPFAGAFLLVIAAIALVFAIAFVRVKKRIGHARG